jgi:signal transduction histidine kinase
MKAEGKVPRSDGPPAGSTRQYALIDWFILDPATRRDPDGLRRARLLVLSAALFAVPTLLFFQQTASLPGVPPLIPAAFLVVAVLLLFTPFLLRWTGSSRLAGTFLTCACLAFDFFIAFVSGGFAVSALLWVTTTPLLAAFFVGSRMSLVVAGIASAGMTGLFALHRSGYAFPRLAAAPEEADWFALLSLLSVTILVAVVGWLFEKQTSRGLLQVYRELRAAHAALQERERGLVEAKEQAEELNRLQSTFLANMSHEIRTPLTSILGFAEILADEAGAEGQGFATLIHRNGRRLMEALNSVLDLAQIEGGTLTLRRERIDLGERAREAVQLLQPLAADRRLYLRAETPPTPVPALLDPSACDRILNNLLSNAVKFTERGGVTVRVAREGAEAVLRVEDTGIGIHPSFLPYLFDAFQQEAKGFRRSYEGVGLGLTITKGLVDLMQGRIDVASTPGEGTAFTVRFPLAPGP